MDSWDLMFGNFWKWLWCRLKFGLIATWNGDRNILTNKMLSNIFPKISITSKDEDSFSHNKISIILSILLKGYKHLITQSKNNIFIAKFHFNFDAFALVVWFEKMK